jgi:ABC-type uncharacterized transport system permease subunit
MGESDGRGHDDSGCDKGARSQVDIERKPTLFNAVSQAVLFDALLLPIIGVGIALAIGAVIIYFMGIDPLRAYSYLLKGSLGGKNSLAETLIKATPICLTGLGVAFAYRCGLVNIGAEGQLYMGALASTAMGIYGAAWGLPTIIHLPLTLLAGFLAGGIWGSVPGWLKAKYGINEIINTIMFNYIAIYLISYAVTGPLKEQPGFMPQTALIPRSATLPIFLKGTRLHLGFVVALLCVMAFYLILWRTGIGYQIRVVGLNPRAARHAGLNVSMSMVLAMFMSGGLAGLAGAGEILGVLKRLYAGFSPGYGFDGIAVALIGRNTPVGVLAAALLLGALRSGVNAMQMGVGVPIGVIYVIQGTLIIFVVSGRVFGRPKRGMTVPKDAKSLLRRAFQAEEPTGAERSECSVTPGGVDFRWNSVRS